MLFPTVYRNCNSVTAANAHDFIDRQPYAATSIKWTNHFSEGIAVAITIRYDTRCHFNVRSKAYLCLCQLNF